MELTIEDKIKELFHIAVPEKIAEIMFNSAVISPLDLERFMDRLNAEINKTK